MDLEVGEVCLLNQATKVLKHCDTCIITKAKSSEDGVVHTVTLGLCIGRAKGGKFFPLELKIAVRRLSLILPACELSKDGLVATSFRMDR